jgi:hypothetical protein
MLATWKIPSEVDGKILVITVERAENGKDLIRINGHVAAKPISPGEGGAVISVAGQSYMVSRKGPDSYTLVRDISADAQARTRETAQAILAHAPTPMMSTSAPLSRLFPIAAWVAVVVSIAAVLLWAAPKSYDKLAAQRVRSMLIEMKVGRNPDYRRAILLWGKAPYPMDAQELSWASNGFDKWRREKKLYNRPFTNFDVTSSKIVEGTKVPTAIVTFTIESTEYKARVVRGAPMTWEE